MSGRTTILIDLPDDVWRDVQKAAKRRGVSGETLVGYWLEQHVSRRTRGLRTEGDEPAGTWSDARAAETMIEQVAEMLEHARTLLGDAAKPPAEELVPEPGEDGRLTEPRWAAAIKTYGKAMDSLAVVRDMLAPHAGSSTGVDDAIGRLDDLIEASTGATTALQDAILGEG